MKGKKPLSMPTMDQVEAEQKRNEYKNRYRQTLGSTISALLVIAAIAVLISTLFLPVVQVVGNSMEPTLHDGDVYVLIKSDSYARGDICCISWQNKKLLKRVIGLPGDIINIEEDGDVYVNGEYLTENYVTDKSQGVCDIEFPYQVPDGKLFVLGDHRATSIDSRSETIGSIGKEQIVGHTLIRVWPIWESED